MDDRLEIYALGGLTIKLNGAPIADFTVRKVEALLTYLAYTGRVQRREILTEMLWDGRSQVQSLHNLRTVLSELRQRLAGFVVADRETVALNPASAVWLDAVELDKTLSTASSWRQTSSISAAESSQLAHTIDLYRGDFLEGFYIRECSGFEDWIRSERERLRGKLILALHFLIDSCLHSGAYPEGIAQTVRLLQLDPLREEAHRQMMLLLAYTGQRQAALKQFEICRDILQTELQLEPTVESTALHKAIQSGQLFERTVPNGHRVPTVPSALSAVPGQATPFFGREEELATIAERLSDPNCRLLNLTGPGGIGKTRLAQAAAVIHAGTFRHGVRWIPLAAVITADLIVSSIADVLEISLHGKKDPSLRLVEYFEDKHMLLIIDNFEHLREGVGLLITILATSPDLKIMVTSRERLNIQEEWALPIEGLDYPNRQPKRETAPAENYGAVQLFIQSARRIQPRFSFNENKDAIIAICQAVEGMPLGIELAVPWLRIIPCSQIAFQIQQDLDFLVTPIRNIPERHRQMRVVFEHSWRLLTEIERRVLMQLSVFRGGFDLAAAEQVAGSTLSILASLIDKSFIRLNSTRRYEMHELIRQYAADQLQTTGYARDTARSHFEFFLTVSENTEVQFRGPHLVAYIDRVLTEFDNIRTALQWSIDDGEAVAGLRLAVALAWFWTHNTSRIEGRAWVEKLLTKANPVDISIRAQALMVIGNLTFTLGEAERGESILETSLVLARQTEDTLTTGRILRQLGWARNGRNELIGAKSYLEEALVLFRKGNARHEIAYVLCLFATPIRRLGDTMRAAALLDEAFMLARQEQYNDVLGWALNGLGDIAWNLGRDPRYVMALYEESLTHFQELKFVQLVGVTLDRIGAVAQAQRDYSRAAAYYSRAITFNQEKSYNMGISWTLALVGGLELQRRRLISSAKLFGAVDDYRQSLRCRSPFGDLTQYERDIATARAQLGADVFDAAWTAGRALSIEQAATYALQQLSAEDEESAAI